MRASTYSTPSAFQIPRKVLDFENLMLLLLPLASVFSFAVVGKLLVSDLLIVLVFFRLLHKRKISLRAPYLRGLLLMLLVWFLGAIVSDFVNQSPVRNLLRGWAKLSFFLIYIVVIFNLVDGRRDRASLGLIGVAIGMMIKPDDAAAIFATSGLEKYWRYGLGIGVTILFGFLISYWFGNRRFTSMMIMLLSPVHLFMNARSTFLVAFLAAALSLFSVRIKRGKSRQIAGMIFVTFLLGGLVGGEAIYDKVMRTGVFGEEALQKHLSQTVGGMSILLGGRSESLISTKAISEKPLLGHGSWPENREYRMLFYRLAELEGKRISWDYVSTMTDNLIPTHSMLLGGWVEHGVFGAAFWVYALILGGRALILGVLGPRPATAMELLAVIALIWDIFFSPFGASRRCMETIFLVVSSCLISSNSRSENAKGSIVE